jgi:hypothetical protein
MARLGNTDGASAQGCGARLWRQSSHLDFQDNLVTVMVAMSPYYSYRYAIIQIVQHDASSTCKWQRQELGEGPEPN